MEAGQKKLDVVTFGETMGLLYPEGSRGIGYGGSMAQSFGGAESNVAVGLSRLGCRSGWISMLGDDPLGHGIFRTLRGEGVDVSGVKFTRRAPTGLMLRELARGRLSVYYYRAGSAASGLGPADLDETYLAQANIMHMTGITPALSVSCLDTARTAIALAKKHGVKVCFDPNLRLKLWDLAKAREVILELAESADYFLPGFDELKLLFETEDKSEIVSRVAAFPGVTVIKSVDHENWIVDNGQKTTIPFERAENVVDPVGAGDGFCAGFLAGMVKQYPLAEAVRLGGLVGSLVVQAAGDWEALPFWSEVEQLLARSPHIER